MGKEERIAVYEDTKRRCKTDPRLREAIEKTNRGQEILLQGTEIQGKAVEYEVPAKIVLSQRRSFEAASHYAGRKVCVLNFASAMNPGGGVTRGSTAQEECLCRCSTLHFSLLERKAWDEFYARHRQSGDSLNNDDCIYSPGVVVFKENTALPALLPEEQWFSVNVITCAAPRLAGNEKIGNDQLRKLHEKRLRRILQIAAARGNEVVILGAFGCGAFHNPPDVVAKAMASVTAEYQRNFRQIEFAVYCSPQDSENYWAFKRALNGLLSRQ